MSYPTPQMYAHETIRTAHVRHASRAAVHMIGIALMIPGLIGAVFAAAIVGFGTSYCGDGPTPDQVTGLRQGLGVIGIALAIIPAGTAFVGSRRGARWEPWAAVAAILLGVTAAIATSAEPTQYCMF